MFKQLNTPENVKTVVKLLVGLGYSILIGTIYKAGQETEAKVDEYYLKRHNVPKK